jgi:phosphoglycolate phosphatase
MYEAVGIDFSLHSYDEMAHEWHAVYQNYRPSITLHHDSLTALETFRRRGARQMILSALPQEHLHSSAHQFGVADYFERIVGVSDNRGQGKRAEGAWLLQETGAPASDVTIIGDSSHDAEIARELRLNCILVARGAESRSRLETHGYPVHESLDALLSQITIG